MQDPKLPNRRSVRLKTYDYSQPAAYFVTICSHGNRSIFGQITSKQMELNPVGQAANQSWIALAYHFPNIRLSAYAVMPNHVHGIISVRERGAPSVRGTAERHLATALPSTGSLATIIRSFKAAVSKEVRRLTNKPGFEVWQRGYYEHIIRDQRDYQKICEYIRLNPVR